MCKLHNIASLVWLQKTGKLFTGPTARSKPSEYLEKYRVFVVGKKFDTNLKLQRGKIVLHQVRN